jgi:rRNA maturation RNase YbeY
MSEPSIIFHSEDVSIPNSIDEISYKRWIEKIVEDEQKSIGFLNFIFCSDEHLLQINKQYLDHDYYTDIITFPFRQDDVIEGDIFISVDRVAENAIEYGETFEREMDRVMSHGVLHLLGYNDKTIEDSARMRQAEDRALQIKYSNEII